MGCSLSSPQSLGETKRQITVDQRPGNWSVLSGADTSPVHSPSQHSGEADSFRGKEYPEGWPHLWNFWKVLQEQCYSLRVCWVLEGCLSWFPFQFLFPPLPPSTSLILQQRFFSVPLGLGPRKAKGAWNTFISKGECTKWSVWKTYGPEKRKGTGSCQKDPATS